MRLLKPIVLFVLVALALLVPKPVANAASSGYQFYGDRYWQVVAYVQNPLNGKKYSTQPGLNYGSVPHNCTYWNDLQASNVGGLSQHYYTRVGSLSRYDRGGGFFRDFNDAYRNNYQPSTSSRPAYDYFQWWNPSSSYWWDNVYVTPAGQYSYCDGDTSCTDHALGYVTLRVKDRHVYQVIPQ